MNDLDATPEAKENFFLTISILAGRPKGLGYAQMRRSTMVGAKTPPAAPDIDRVTDISKFSYMAGVHKIATTDVEALYREYEEWYRDYEAKLQH